MIDRHKKSKRAAREWAGSLVSGGCWSGCTAVLPPPLLRLRDVLGGGSLLSLDDVEFHPVTFGETAETVHLDRRVVNEAMLVPFSGVMSPKTFASLNHFTTPIVRAIPSKLLLVKEVRGRRGTPDWTGKREFLAP